jgi:hypothetical protein
MTILRRSVPLVVAALLAVSAAAGASKPISLTLKLPAKPVFPAPEMTALLTAGPLSLEVIDARSVDEPSVVGAMRERGENVYVWKSGKPVAGAVRELAARLLRDWQVRVAPEAEFGLKLSLTSYYVTEKSETFGSTYMADVRFDVAYVDRAGSPLWTGEAAGSARNAGVDARASMCNEVLSVALRAALAKAMSSVSLEAAPPARPGAPVARTTDPPPSFARIEPGALFADLTRLKAGGVADDVLVAYVAQRQLSRPLTVDEILRWKDAGIPDAAIKSATGRP